ncbi:hypothetical protein FA95DRAFT_1583949 [Auriscalpium vulgare]|uniref:Uncharacterized protein n=1 Tax=Auriscalpium vulgare TaxID=40419 RepID=A0ACB8RJ20_9AGAM|nr:hypothetical protein FA95DRAFT_1583949 [Auriscalpium vulgare]
MASEPEFQSDMFRWVESIIHCELPGMSEVVRNSAALRRPEPLPGIDVRAQDPPAAPRNMNDQERVAFETNFRDFVKELAIACNWHGLKPGQPRDDAHCRMRMTGETRALTELDPETSALLLRRLHPWINNFNDGNMDIKYIGSGEAAKALVYYITDYITKSSLPMHLGLKALKYAIERNGVKFQDRAGATENDVNSSLIMKVVNAIMASGEMSHQQVMSYNVGGGDKYTNKIFTHLYWRDLDRYIRAEEDPGERVGFLEEDEEDDSEMPVNHATVGSSNDRQVTVTVRRGNLTISNFVLDYRLRSDVPEFERLSVWDHAALVHRLPKTEEKSRMDRVHALWSLEIEQRGG